MKIKNMTKEELELLSYKDITNLLLEEKGKMNTASLFKEIVTLLELPNSVFENKIGDYYTSLTTDKRFILLTDGTWDLRTRHASDKVIVLEEDDDEELEDVKEEIDEDIQEEGNDFDMDETEDDYDDGDDELKDLVVIDEDEMELEQ